MKQTVALYFLVPVLLAYSFYYYYYFLLQLYSFTMHTREFHSCEGKNKVY